MSALFGSHIPCSVWSSNHLIHLSEQSRIEVNGGDLRISKLTMEDSGMYQCVGENKHGIIYASAELSVQGMFWISKDFAGSSNVI